MANRHFAKLADVWKHLALVEILATDRPDRYWESHAGSALYEMVDDAERRYGVQRFVEVAPRFPALDSSRYLDHLRTLNDAPGGVVRYPGSGLLAMMELGASCSYLLCDLDAASVDDLQAARARVGMDARADVRRVDGMTELHRALPSVPAGDTVTVHVDPYDPWAAGPGGLTALDVAAEMVDAGLKVVYWYGYDRPGDRAWAIDELAQRPPVRSLWCGDVMVLPATGVPRGGDLGVATTPGTGCGVVCANLSPEAVESARRLGRALEAAYDGATLPNGERGRVEFTATTAGSMP